MKALLLVAHGSRRRASNEEVVALSAVIAREMKDNYPVVEACFLELAEPSIPEALDRCISKGATDIFIVPYFLSAGRHVHADIPGEVDKARALHNGIAMTILPHIGAALQMKDLIRNVVREGTHAG